MTYSHIFSAVVPVLAPFVTVTPENREFHASFLRVATWRDHRCVGLDMILHRQREFIRCAALE